MAVGSGFGTLYSNSAAAGALKQTGASPAAGSTTAPAVTAAPASNYDYLQNQNYTNSMATPLASTNASNPLAASVTPAAGTPPPSNPQPAGTASGSPPADASMVDLTGVNSYYDKASGVAQNQLDSIKQQSDRYTSGLQAANAANAARMGLAAGGASYLSGQRSAAAQGLQNYANNTGQASAALEGIYQNQGGANLSGTQFNANRSGQVMDKTADAQATTQANQTVDSITAAKTSLKNLNIDVDAQKGAGWGDAKVLLDQINQPGATDAQKQQSLKDLSVVTNNLAELKNMYPDRFKAGKKAWDDVVNAYYPNGLWAPKVGLNAATMAKLAKV